MSFIKTETEEEKQILAEFHKTMVEAGFGTSDPQVYWLSEVIDTFLKVPDLDDFPPRFYEQITEEKYPNTLQLARWVVKGKKEGMQRFNATPGTSATMETFAAAIVQAYEDIEAGLTIDVDVDSYHPSMRIEVDSFTNPGKMERYRALCKQWDGWHRAEEDRKWRNAYKKAGRPIPEEYGLERTWDDEEIVLPIDLLHLDVINLLEYHLRNAPKDDLYRDRFKKAIEMIVKRVGYKP